MLITTKSTFIFTLWRNLHPHTQHDNFIKFVKKTKTLQYIQNSSRRLMLCFSNCQNIKVEEIFKVHTDPVFLRYKLMIDPKHKDKSQIVLVHTPRKQFPCDLLQVRPKIIYKSLKIWTILICPQIEIIMKLKSFLRGWSWAANYCQMSSEHTSQFVKNKHNIYYPHEPDSQITWHWKYNRDFLSG